MIRLVSAGGVTRAPNDGFAGGRHPPQRNRRRLRPMSRLLVALAGAALLAPAQHPASRLLTIDFVALDRNGIPVVDLTPSDIDVRIGQFRAPVDTLRLVTPETDERGGRLLV